jgi:hypothetical protein
MELTTIIINRLLIQGLRANSQFKEVDILAKTLIPLVGIDLEAMIAIDLMLHLALIMLAITNQKGVGLK